MLNRGANRLCPAIDYGKRRYVGRPAQDADISCFVSLPPTWVEGFRPRAQLPRGRDTHAFTTACLVIALTFAGCGAEARAAANGLIDTAEATHNPWALSLALWAYGTAFRHADPVRRT